MQEETGESGQIAGRSTAIPAARREPGRSPLARGLLVIGIMLLLAGLLGGYAWWVQYQKGRRILEYFGPRATWLVRHAERVELLLLDSREAPAAAGGREPEAGLADLEIDGRRFPVRQRFEIGQIRGLVHARHTLVVDSSYTWAAPRGTCQADWRFALVFRGEGEQATLAFDAGCHRVRLLESERELGLHVPLSEVLHERSDRWAQQGVALDQPGPAEPAAPRH
ncbi:MAG: hypothetical protein J5I93_00320 [Pirellulaceae bacterium]|nr:hypothetical protein [Pirellulaceae bacterium]